jgi:undecaprenyl-diphosphatase
MNIIKYLILGIIQGVTEPLPVSSSGHLILYKALFNTTIFDSLNFEIISNFGSFLAIIFIFRKDLIDLIKSFTSYIFIKEKRKLTKDKFSYVIKIMLSTIPVGITGFLLKDKIENLNNINFLGFAFLFTALILFIVRNINGEKDDFKINIKDAIIIGIVEAITIMPGISRSGTVLVACLLRNIKKDNALKYTFMLYFPVSIAAMALGINDFLKTPNLNDMLLPYTIGMIAACITTYFTYIWLTNIVKKGKLVYFTIYCLLLSLFIFVYFN